MAHTKTNTQNSMKHTEQHDKQTFKTNLCVCVGFFHFYLYFIFIKMISPRNVELPPWYGQWPHWGFKPVLSYSKPYTYYTYFGEVKTWNEKHLFSIPRPLSIWTKLRKMKWNHILIGREKKRILSTHVFCLWKSSQVGGRWAWLRRQSEY